MAVNPEVDLKLSADTTGLVKGVDVAKGALAGLKAEMMALQSVGAKSLSFLGFGGVAAAATAAAGAIGAAVTAAAEYGNQLDAMSQRTGVAVEDLSRLQYAAKISETSAEALGMGLTKLAPLIASAAAGAPESGKLFERFGIAARNVDGSVRGVSDVLGDLADIFAAMPDGTQKTALAVEFFGKKMGGELIPLLNQGRAGLKALGDEAERLGLVLNEKQTKAAAELDDNLDKLAQRSKSTAVAIGNFLIPALNRMLEEFEKARQGSDGLLVSFLKYPFGLASFQKAAKAADDVKRLNAELSALEDKISIGRGTPGDSLRFIAAQAELEAAKKLLPTEEDTTAKRLALASALAGKMKQLEQLRAISAGEVSADVLKSDKELNAARLKDAEKLRDALRSAYESSTKDAKSAADEAVKLSDKARSKRTGAADKALEASTADLSPEDKSQAMFSQAQSLFDEGRYFVAAAAAANLDKRSKVADGYQKQADEFLARAESFADKSGNQELIGNIAEVQARILESQAAAKQKEAADLEQRAASQMELLSQVEAKIKDMTAAAANFEIKADITQLESDIARIKKEIGAGAVMPVTVAPFTPGGASGVAGTGATGEFSGGGFTGWGGRGQVAGVVHGMEYVTPAGITLQPGVIPFLEALRRHGNKVLPGYSSGGLVAGLQSGVPRSAPSVAAARSGATPLVLDFGKLGRFDASAPANTAEAIERVFVRAALARGRR